MMITDPSLTPEKLYLFNQGVYYHSYRLFGAHLMENGVRFTVWCPDVTQVDVVGDFSGWNPCPLTQQGTTGIWSAVIDSANEGDLYKYRITTRSGEVFDKSDPYAFSAEVRPGTASRVVSLDGYQWHDGAWRSARKRKKSPGPMNIYEVHLGSWKQRENPEDPNQPFLTYRELADQLIPYARDMGYTHLELMPVMEHPFDGSWGYQVTGFYAPTARYGTPDDFRYFVDRLHRSGIGVILDWVPAHFPKDDFGLEFFDGTPLYESVDPLRREYPEWGTNAFDHSKPEVRSFLISSACYWVREFHIDALRVDAVAAMLYADYSRKDWRPNRFGGRINLESRAFLQQLNTTVCGATTGYLIAEDSSTEDGITRDVRWDGVGFTLKWDMGWMNDSLRYVSKDPVYRRFHHEELAHTVDYAFAENWVLVLSHDEVVHLKRSMAEKAPGSQGDRLATLKTLYTYQFTHPGKKLLFMGQDFAMEREWSEAREIDWYLAEDFAHRDVLQCVRNLLALYKRYPVLYSDSQNPTTFEWVNRHDADRNIFSYIRRNPWNYDGALLVVLNFSPMGVGDYTVGVPLGGLYPRVFSSYDSLPGQGNPAEVGGIPPMTAEQHDCDGYPYMLRYGLRPFEALIIEFPKFD